MYFWDLQWGIDNWKNSLVYYTEDLDDELHCQISMLCSIDWMRQHITYDDVQKKLKKENLW